MCLAAGAPTAAADQIDTLARTVDGEGSEKARISAVVSLGRLADPRAFSPLARALAGDRSAVVRGVAASALGHLADARAIPALERALGDRDAGVRARAQDALDRLRRPAARRPRPVEAAMPTKARFAPREAPRRNVQVAVNRMGNKATGSSHLSGRMHDLVVRQLADAPGVIVADATGAELVVDGAITKLRSELRGPYVEVTCEVRLTVSSATGSLLSIVSGGATVQAKKAATRNGVELEALENAVRGVQGNLLAFVARRAGL